MVCARWNCHHDPQPDPVLHRLVETRDSAGLDTPLDDSVVFHSPVVHTPQVGKAITRLYLLAAMTQKK